MEDKSADNLTEDPRGAQVGRLAYTHRILSFQTWSQHLRLDYNQEQKYFDVQWELAS